MRVANETRTPWAPGAVVVFDDSYEHEVAHDGDHDRLVLDVNVAHPLLAAREGRPPGSCATGAHGASTTGGRLL